VGRVRDGDTAKDTDNTGCLSMIKERGGLTAKQWLGGVFLATTIVALLIFIPKVQVYGLRHMLRSTPSHFSDEDRARQTLATIIGGMVVLAGGYLTWLNVQVAQKNAKIAEDKLITDRFTAAVNNLSTAGDDKMATRLGGIYALERIARDSAEDHWTIMEVLTAYVRDKRPWDATAKHDEDDKLTASTELATPRRLPTDIQALLTVIGKRNVEYDKDNLLTLDNADLAYADLRELNFAKADFHFVNLVLADLRGADLHNANILATNLSGAYLVGANLRGASLQLSTLRRVDLSGANLEGVDVLLARVVVSN